jgi:DNA-binding protein Fis
MAFAVARNEGRAETRFVAPVMSPPVNPGLVIALAETMQKHQISAEELRRKVDEAVAKKDLDATSTAKLYNVALGACQVDYLEVLEKFPQQPSPDMYDRNAMRSLYLAAKSEECDKYFQKMGWSQGCEVTPVADACQDLTTHWQQYQQNFRKAQKDATTPPCAKDEDCFLSEAGACGERLIGSKLEIDPAIDQLENVLACPLRKRAALCLRQNPRAFADCPPRKDEFAVCRESICKAIPLSEKLHPSPPPAPPEPTLTQSFLFKNDQDCSEQISATTQRFGHPTAAEILSNSCDSKYFQGLAEIAHARVAAVLTKSGKPTQIRLKILKNYGRIALPENFDMDWPAPLFSKGDKDIVFETPKVGVEGILGFYESFHTRIALHPLQPKLSEAARRTLTPELLALLEANKKKFPTPKQVRQILAAQELNRQKSCNHYDKILGETDLPVIDVMAEKRCLRGFTYFNQGPGAKSNMLRLFLRGERTVGEVNERLKTCGGQIHETGMFLSVIIPSAKNVAEMEKVQKCYEEKGIFEASIDTTPDID